MTVSFGSAFVVTSLVAPCTANELLADGQVTEPSTAGLVVAFHVFVAVSIQSPVCAAPPRRKFVVHESTSPTRGSVETFPSPNGIAVGDTAGPFHAFSPPDVGALAVVDDGVDRLELEPPSLPHDTNSTPMRTVIAKVRADSTRPRAHSETHRTVLPHDEHPKSNAVACPKPHRPLHPMQAHALRHERRPNIDPIHSEVASHRPILSGLGADPSDLPSDRRSVTPPRRSRSRCSWAV